MADPRVREVGRLADIDGMAVAVCTEGDRVRLEVGMSVAVLGTAQLEQFAQVLVRAAWLAGTQEGEPTW